MFHWGILNIGQVIQALEAPLTPYNSRLNVVLVTRQNISQRARGQAFWLPSPQREELGMRANHPAIQQRWLKNLLSLQRHCEILSALELKEQRSGQNFSEALAASGASMIRTIDKDAYHPLNLCCLQRPPTQR